MRDPGPAIKTPAPKQAVVRTSLRRCPHAPGTEVDHKYAKAVTDLMHWHVEDEDAVRVAAAQFRLEKSLTALRQFLTGPWNSNKMVHHCPLGCCSSIEESRQKLVDLLLDVLVCRLPPIPACNRWTKLFPAVSWFTSGALICNVLPRLWDRDTIDAADAGGELMQDLLQPGSEEIERKLNRARNAKVTNWLHHKHTPKDRRLTQASLRPMEALAPKSVARRACKVISGQDCAKGVSKDAG